MVNVWWTLTIVSSVIIKVIKNTTVFFLQQILCIHHVWNLARDWESRLPSLLATDVNFCLLILPYRQHFTVHCSLLQISPLPHWKKCEDSCILFYFILFLFLPYFTLQYYIGFAIQRLISWIYLSLPLYNQKGFDLDHTWMV